jgi:predicted enzyme related to lactoylglutathione lyase
MIGVTEVAFMCYPVTDIARAFAFYEGVLGLKVGATFGEGDQKWIEFDIGPTTFAITNMGGADWQPFGNGPSIALEVEDFNAAVQKLKDHAAPVKMGPCDTPVCRMVMISDPDGNTLTIHKRKPAAATTD